MSEEKVETEIEARVVETLQLPSGAKKKKRSLSGAADDDVEEAMDSRSPTPSKRRKLEASPMSTDSTPTPVPMPMHPPLAKTPEDIESLRKFMVDCTLKWTVADLAIDNTPVVLSSSLTPREALEELIKRHIRSAPVIDEGKFVGVLDIRDFLKHAVSEHRHEHSTAHIDVDPDAVYSALHFMARSTFVATNTLVYLARMRRFWGIRDSETVYAAMKMMSCGPHILGVLGADGELKSILSQGQLFGLCAQKWRSLPKDIFAQELVKLRVASAPVVSVPFNTPAHTTFELMAERGLSGVAIVDGSGQLLHNTSATDIKLWALSSHSLDATIEDFLVEIRKHSSARKAMFPVANVHFSDGLQRIVGKLRVTGYHRLWIVDGEHKPVGVVSLSDVFKFVVGDSKHEEGEVMATGSVQ